MVNVKPSDYIMGIIMFTLVMTAGIGMIVVLRNNDLALFSASDSDKFEQFNRTFNKLEDANSSIYAIQNNIENVEEDPSIFGMLNALIAGAWNTLRLLFTSFGFMNSVFIGFSTFFGVPAYIMGIILLIPIIIIGFAIFSAIFQGDM